MEWRARRGLHPIFCAMMFFLFAVAGFASGAEEEDEERQVVEILTKQLPLDLAELIARKSRMVEVTITNHRELGEFFTRLMEEPSRDWTIHCADLIGLSTFHNRLMMFTENNRPLDVHDRKKHGIHLIRHGFNHENASEILDSWQAIRAHKLFSARSSLTLHQLRICPIELCHPLWKLGGAGTSESERQAVAGIENAGVVEVQIAAIFSGPRGNAALMSSLARSKPLQAVFADVQELALCPDERFSVQNLDNEHDLAAENILYLAASAIPAENCPWGDWRQVATLVNTLLPSMPALQRVLSGTAMAAVGSLCQTLEKIREIEATLNASDRRCVNLCFYSFVYFGTLDEFLCELTQLSPSECSIWSGLRFRKILLFQRGASRRFRQLPAAGWVTEGRSWESYFPFIQSILVCGCGLEDRMRNKESLRGELSSKLGWSEQLSSCCIPVLSCGDLHRTPWYEWNRPDDLRQLEAKLRTTTTHDRDNHPR